jgi:hypothetical protein
MPLVIRNASTSSTRLPFDPLPLGIPVPLPFDGEAAGAEDSPLLDEALPGPAAIFSRRNFVAAGPSPFAMSLME